MLHALLRLTPRWPGDCGPGPHHLAARGFLMAPRLTVVAIGLLTLLLAATVPASLRAADCTSDTDKMTRGVEEPWGSMTALDPCEFYPTPVPTATPLPPTPRPVLGKWRYNWWTDSLTGKKFEVARLAATSRTGYGDATPVLFLRCVVGGRDSMPANLGGTGRAAVWIPAFAGMTMYAKVSRGRSRGKGRGVRRRLQGVPARVWWCRLSGR